MDSIKVPDLFSERTGRSLSDWIGYHRFTGKLPGIGNDYGYRTGNDLAKMDDYKTQRPHVEVGAQFNNEHPTYSPPSEIKFDPIRKPQAQTPNNVPRAVRDQMPTLNVPRNPNAYQAHARGNLNKYGWGDNEFQPLYNLWKRESGWNPNAKNPDSSARGIAQTMMSVHFGGKGWASRPDSQDFLRNPTRQVDWGMRYIKQRYGSPSNAWDFWKKNNYY